MPPRLTPKQQSFVAEFLVDLNAAAAARRAGYSEKTADRIGHENLKKPEIAEAIQAAQAERVKRTQINQDYVLTNLQEVVERSMQRAPVRDARGKHVMDSEGNHLWAFQGKTAVSALQLLAQHLGMLKHKVEYTGKAGGPLQIQIVEELVDGNPDGAHPAP